MNVSLTVLISLVCTLVGAGAAILTLRRSAAKADNEEGKTSGTILTEIGYIKSGVDDIKRHQEKQDDQYLDLRQRVTTVEASAKQAHKRLDNIEATCKNHHDCVTRRD